ncbi:hypothetical protein EAE99_001591 [Botrytis elliptica]|nr:hypothetical protein EAE99_001591 [Botrytis elliptica]
MLFRPSADFLSFYDMHRMKEYTDMVTLYKFHQSSGVKFKRVSIAAHPVWPKYPFRSNTVFQREPVQDPAREIWKLILLFEDLEDNLPLSVYLVLRKVTEGTWPTETPT